MRFQEKHSFEKRQMESKKELEENPDRIPCIVEKAKNSKIMDIERNKLRIPNTLTIKEALYIFIGEIMPNDTEIMSSIYEKYKNEDGFLYITYEGESTFG
ncbi:autophagy 8 [Neocallimastix lanati (nom. inval.)]|nr:autophagy 8 [Neocallimastix sp. JGI-2020a]